MLSYPWQKPSRSALEASARRNADLLADIEDAKTEFAAAIENLICRAKALGATEAAAITARNSAEDVVSDLFWEIEMDAADRVDGDEHLLEG